MSIRCISCGIHWNSQYIDGQQNLSLHCRATCNWIVKDCKSPGTRMYLPEGILFTWLRVKCYGLPLQFQVQISLGIYIEVGILQNWRQRYFLAAKGHICWSLLLRQCNWLADLSPGLSRMRCAIPWALQSQKHSSQEIHLPLCTGANSAGRTPGAQRTALSLRAYFE